MIVLLSFRPCFSQNTKLVDNLLAVIDTSRNNTTIIDARNEIAYLWRYSNIEAAEEMASAALEFSKKVDYLKGEGDANMRLGLVMKNRGCYAEAISHYNEARRIRTMFPDNEETVASTHNTIADVYRQIGHYGEAIIEYELGLGLLNSTGKDIRLKGNLLNGLAIVSREIEKYDEALLYADRCIALRTELKDSLGLANALMTSATIFTELENFEKAAVQLSTALSIFQDAENLRGQIKIWVNLAGLSFYQKNNAKAIKYYEEALAHPTGLTEFDKAQIWQGLGTVYQVQGKLDRAIMLFEQSLAIHEEQANIGGQASLLYSIGESYRDAEQYQEAITLLNRALNLLPNTPVTDIHLDIYYSLTEALSSLGQWELALKHARKHIHAKKEIIQARRTPNYRVNYEVERRRRIVAEKEEALAISEAQRKQQWTYIVGGGLGSLLIIGTISFLWYFQKRKRKDAETKIDILLIEQEIKTNYARLQGEDQERKRLARDLHDRIGSMLSTIKLYLLALDTQIDTTRKDGREQYQKATDLLEVTSEEVRQVANNLHSNVLTKFGLVAQLKDLANTIKDSQQIEVEITTHEMDNRMDSILEVEVYRITQELVANALKHAKANKLSIQLSRFKNVLNLIIEDNGIGFKIEEIKAQQGMGLDNIRSRVNALDGTLQIDSTPNRGTSISIDIPLKEKSISL